MRLTVELTPDVERMLMEQARQSGQNLADFAAALLADAARDREDSAALQRQADIAARLSALERIGSYTTRCRAGLPALSDRDVSRESLYEGRGP